MELCHLTTKLNVIFGQILSPLRRQKRDDEKGKEDLLLLLASGESTASVVKPSSSCVSAKGLLKMISEIFIRAGVIL